MGYWRWRVGASSVLRPYTYMVDTYLEVAEAHIKALLADFETHSGMVARLPSSRLVSRFGPGSRRAFRFPYSWSAHVLKDALPASDSANDLDSIAVGKGHMK